MEIFNNYVVGAWCGPQRYIVGPIVCIMYINGLPFIEVILTTQTLSVVFLQVIFGLMYQQRRFLL